MTLQENKKYTREITQKGAVYPCADLEGGRGGRTPPPPEFAKLNIADITGNEKISYFSYLCIGPPGKIFWIRADTDVRLITHQQ